MSTKKSSKAELRKKAMKRRKEYSNLALIIIVIVLVGIAILVGNLIKNRNTAQNNPESNSSSGAPAMVIDTSKQYLATVKMAKGGEFTIELYADKAPVTVNNFVVLARQGFYDGVTFHRVIENFMAQTGDPTGTGSGGPGYQFADEINDLKFDKAGVVAMANAGADTNGSQFFITYAPTDWLDGKHTIFGQVISGMDVVTALTLRDPNENPTFTGDVIESITITEN